MSKCTLDFDQEMAMAIAASLDDIEVVKVVPAPPQRMLTPAQAALRSIKQEEPAAKAAAECSVCAGNDRLNFTPCMHPICTTCFLSWRESKGPSPPCPVCRHRLTTLEGAVSSSSGSSSRPQLSESSSSSYESDSDSYGDYYYYEGGAGADVRGGCKGGSCSSGGSCSKKRGGSGSSAPKSKKVKREKGQAVQVRGYYVKPHTRAAPSKHRR